MRIVCSISVLLGAGLLLAQPSHSQVPAAGPTFSKDVAPIFYENCVSCHRPGEMAPMSLLTYEEARPWARSIREAILEGSMPPWHAEAPAGTFLNERQISQAERTTIVEWVDTGAGEGNRRDLPEAPEFTDGWTVGTPDAIVAMRREFEVPESGEIPYQYFQTATGFDEDVWVQAIEIRPGEPSVVHHVLVYAKAPEDEDGETRSPVFFAANPVPEIAGRRGPVAEFFAGLVGRGREDRRENGERRGNNLGELIATTAPGTNAQVFPAGRAMQIKAGSVLTFQVHYTSTGTAATDRTRVGFVFADGAPEHEVRVDAFLNALFRIPSGAPDHRVDSAIEFVQEAQILAIFPHTHLRGKSWEYRMVYPDGRSEVVLSVPNYDFNWQTYYEFADPIAAPVGSRLEGIAHYDNSAANPDNPDPGSNVGWGDQTWEEMQYTGIAFIVADSSGAP